MSAKAPAPDDPATTASGAEASSPKTCPSSLCEEGAVVLGVMTAQGRLAYVHPPAEVDAEFVARERTRGHPERRFRFAAPCVEGDCPQWTGCGCAIADMAAESPLASRSSSRRLPACSIRRSCRWFSQRGADACAVCPLIVADMGGTETYRSTHPDHTQNSGPRR
jgi:hypothetical protein